MSSKRVAFDHAVYFLVFVLALAFRLLELGAIPLSDFEADWALQALGIVQGSKPLLGPNPGYVLLTAAGFFVFNASNFWARFWPALAGSLIVLAPYFFRERLGRAPAFLLSVFLIFDPGLLAVSRLAGGPVLAVAFLVLAWAMWETKRWPLVGVFGGLALLSGPALWIGAVGLGMALAIGRALASRQPAAGDVTPGAVSESTGLKRFGVALLWGLGTVLLVGTLLFLATNGLSAMAAGLVSFVTGWWTASGVPVNHVLISLPAYAPLALVFGLVAAVRGLRAGERHAAQLALWASVALLLVLVYPARRVADLVWVLLPLYTLAACELDRYLKPPQVDTWGLVGTTALTLVVLTFSWLDLSGIAGLPFAMEITQTRFLLLIGALLLLLISMLLIGVGWSAAMAKYGLVYAGWIGLAAFTIGAAFGATGLREPRTVELWQPAPQTTQADLLVKTLDEISGWQGGQGAAQSVVIHNIDSPALRWLLRDWQVQELSQISGPETPDLVLTSQDVDLSLSAPYRGQDFVWRQNPAWGTASAEDWLRWFVFRKMYQYDENVNLWVREDLFFEADSEVVP